MTAEAPARPGRPSTGARERILAAALEILKADGYAGLTTAKVAAASGQNKALISYHFGGKQGLVAAAAESIRDEVTAAVTAVIGSSASMTELAATGLEAIWGLMERDEGIQRVYFDLASQSVVDPEVERVMAEMKEGFRAILRGRIADLTSLRSAVEVDAVAVFLIAGIEGLALERLDRGETPELERAKRLWVESVAGVG